VLSDGERDLSHGADPGEVALRVDEVPRIKDGITVT
jgi:hypothetical protein